MRFQFYYNNTENTGNQIRDLIAIAISLVYILMVMLILKK